MKCSIRLHLRVPMLVVGMAILASHIWADGAVAAVIEYASGDDVTVIRSGRRLVMQDPIGFELLEGDQVQTGKDVFLELRLSPRASSGNAIIKLAENTTFSLDAIIEGKTTLRLVYGRIRAKLERLSPSDDFSIRSANIVAGVRGTDFGIDVIASKSTMTKSTSQAYCFDGSVEVIALDVPSHSFTLNGGEMLRLEHVQGIPSIIKTQVDKEIQQFWLTNDYVNSGRTAFLSEAYSPDAAQYDALYDEGYAAGLEEAKRLLPMDDDFAALGFMSKREAEYIRKTAMLQKGGIMGGGLIGIGGLALSVRGLILTGQGDVSGGTVYLQAGALISAMAIPFLTLSLFARP